jgi:hypothetical protein
MPKLIESVDIKNRIIELINNNNLFINDELQIFEALINKYKPISISNCSNLLGKKYNSIKYMVNHNSLPFISINNSKHILKSLI